MRSSRWLMQSKCSAHPACFYLSLFLYCFLLSFFPPYFSAWGNGGFAALVLQRVDAWMRVHVCAAVCLRFRCTYPPLLLPPLHRPGTLCNTWTRRQRTALTTKQWRKSRLQTRYSSIRLTWCLKMCFGPSLDVRNTPSYWHALLFREVLLVGCRCSPDGVPLSP